MGVGTILEAAKIILVANGEGKAEAVANAVEGSVTSMCTASALQLHKDTTVFLDRPASGKLQMLDYYKWIQEKSPGAPQHS
jgi:glucosamine-6-phosphate deaminase